MTGEAVAEHERIKPMTAIALKAGEVGLDVFATGEYHNPPFVSAPGAQRLPASPVGWSWS
jgi:hypothetical protein